MLHPLAVDIDFLSKTKPKSPILVIQRDNTSYQSFEDQILGPMLKALDKSFYVFLFYQGDNAIIKKVILSLRGSGFVINDLNQDKNGLHLESWNLKGMKVDNIVLDWMPIAKYYNCNKFHEECMNQDGFMPPIMDIVAKRANFTIVTRMNPNDDWGQKPKSGPWKNGEWGGVMGSVVNGQAHLSTTTWITTLNRYDVLDFIPVFTEHTILASIPKPLYVDMTFFLRPFHTDAWAAITFVLLLNVSLLLVPYLWNKKHDTTQSFLVAETSGWIFFLLVSAFYGGAMTMFFTTQAPLPYESVRDVLKSYPGEKQSMKYLIRHKSFSCLLVSALKLIHMVGMDADFASPASQGDPDYATYWKMVQESPEDFQFASTAKLVERMTNGNVVAYQIHSQFEYFTKNLPMAWKIKTIAASPPYWMHIITTKNSPLSPILKYEISKLLEEGTFQREIRQVLVNQKPDGSPEIMIISAGQVVLVLLVTSLLIVVSLMVMLLEIAHNRSSERKHKAEMWRSGSSALTYSGKIPIRRESI